MQLYTQLEHFVSTLKFVVTMLQEVYFVSGKIEIQEAFNFTNETEITITVTHIDFPPFLIS